MTALVTSHPYGNGVAEILENEDVAVKRGDMPSTSRIAPVISSINETYPSIEVIVVSHRDFCPVELIDACPNLKGIVSTVIGLETVDLHAATERGVLVAHGAMKENYLGVSEATVMLIAALLLDLPGKQKALRDGLTERQMSGRMVIGKRIGLVGLGRSARGVVERLAGWGVDVVAHDPYVEGIESDLRMISLEELLATSDIVSLHVMLTDTTEKMIGEKQLRSMKQDAYLINTSRGRVIDEQSLVRALQEGWIAGAALDVYEKEPLARDHPLRDLQNVILTPHSIGHSRELWEAIPIVAAEQALAILSGRTPRYVVNREILDTKRQ